MKRFLICLIALFCLTVPALADDSFIYDPADVFSAEEELRMEESLSVLRETYGVDTLIAFTDQSMGMDAYDYVPYIYSQLRGSDARPDAAILAVCLDNRTYRLEATGRVIPAMEHYGWDDADMRVQSLLAQNNYFGAAAAWVDILTDACTPKPPFVEALEYMPFVVIIAVLIAAVVVVTMVKQLKTAKHQSAAAAYVVQNSLKLRDASEVFLYETVTVRKIEQSSNSSGGGGGSRSGRGGSF